MKKKTDSQLDMEKSKLIIKFWKASHKKEAYEKMINEINEEQVKRLLIKLKSEGEEK